MILLVITYWPNTDSEFTPIELVPHLFQSLWLADGGYRSLDRDGYVL